MARELTPTRYVYVVIDRISNSEIELYYHLPDNKERVKYANAFTERKGNKIIVKADAFNTRAKFGLATLDGFRTGDFTVDGKPIASDPQDPAFCPQWRDYVLKSASDILARLAADVYGGVQTSADQDQIVLEDLAESGQTGSDQAGAGADQPQGAGDPGAEAGQQGEGSGPLSPQ